MLAIAYDVCESEVLPAVFSSYLLCSRSFEPAGRAYHAAVATYFGVDEEAEGEGEVNTEKLANKRRKLSGVVKDDLYETLDLYLDREEVTPAHVREAYKRLVLLYHPDRYADPAAYTPIAKAKWLKVA